MGSAQIAIELTQFPRQAVDQAAGQFADELRRVDDAGPGHATAGFAMPTEEPGRIGTRRVEGVVDAPVGQSNPSAGATLYPTVRGTRLGDRIIANMTSSQIHTRAPARATPAEAVAAKFSVEAHSVRDLLHLQLKAASAKVRVGLAVAGVHKSTQGVDTLLKSQ